MNNVNSNTNILDLTYIHYGANKYNNEKFKDIKNDRGFGIKPLGGLWCCPTNTNQWFDFVENEMPERNNTDNFKFTLDKKSKIYTIDTLYDLTNLIGWGYTYKRDVWYDETIWIDYEKLSRYYDGIFLTDNGQYETRMPSGNMNLYGWDIESLIIFNQTIINLI